ncbi:MAG: PDZ domain-containing protein, partial [Lachnospiraceae bacterium]|nr:PDZ domain-containing protein [Lachnospiraceae bacterium]
MLRHWCYGEPKCVYEVINVVKVSKGSPAEKAGMLPGDILTGVDDLDVTGMDLS